MRVEDKQRGRRHCCHEERLTPKDEEGDEVIGERSSENGKENKDRVNEKGTAWSESVGIGRSIDQLVRRSLRLVSQRWMG